MKEDLPRAHQYIIYDTIQATDNNQLKYLLR